MPDLTSLHVDQFLSEISIMFRNEAYVADEIYPPVAVDKQSDRYPIYGKENLRRRESRRGFSGLANEVTWSLSSAAYFAEERALRTLVRDSDTQIADDPIQPEVDATTMLSDQVLLGLEFDVAARATSTSIVTNNLDLNTTHRWSDYTLGTPLSDIVTAKNSVRQNVLHRATNFMLPYENALVLADHPSIKDLTKYTDPNGLTESGLPMMLRGLRVIEASAIQDSANEGAAFTGTTVWGNTALIYLRAPAPARRMVSFGYNFVAPDPTVGTRGLATRTYRDDGRKGQWVECSMVYQPVEIAAGGAYLFTNVR